MNHLWGSFLLPRPGFHSWDQQDVTSVQTLGKRGAWQASPSANLSFLLLPNSLNLGTCQVHWKKHLPEVFVGEQLPMVMKGKGKWLRLEGRGCSQCYWGPFECLSGCQELRPWLLLWPTRLILSQVAPRAELTQCCRADPKDFIVCGKAPRNFTTAWTCSLDLPAAKQLVLTFVVVSNQTGSLQAVWAHVYVLAQLAISARIFICLGPSADRGSAEQTRCVLHPAAETGRKNSGETCCIFKASKEQLIPDTELFLGGSSHAALLFWFFFP